MLVTLFAPDDFAARIIVNFSLTLLNYQDDGKEFSCQISSIDKSQSKNFINWEYGGTSAAHYWMPWSRASNNSEGWLLDGMMRVKITIGDWY